MHRLQELVRLHRMGKGARESARVLGMSPNTERRYRRALKLAALFDGPPEELPELAELQAAVAIHAGLLDAPQAASSIADWRVPIEKLLEYGLHPQAIVDRLRQESSDFKGSVGAVKRMVARIRKERGVRATDVVIPVETLPGDVAQVDFGYAGLLHDPITDKDRRAWVFVMVLGHSRKMFAKVVFDQSTSTWLQLHVDAFDVLGGVPRTLVPDNLKAAVIRAAFGRSDDASLNRSYVVLARHYSFIVDPTPPRSPQKKGKVESGVRYVKHNFMKGRQGESIDEVNVALQRWVDEVADVRTHGTTRKVPAEVFRDIEQPELIDLPNRHYERVTYKQVTVHVDSHVQFDRRLYSVPWRWIGKKVWVRATDRSVAIHSGDDEARVATHQRRGRTHRSTVDAHLPDKREAYRHRQPDYWIERADAIHDDVGKLVRQIFTEQKVLSKLRMVQALVLYLEDHSKTRASAACRRALHFGNHNFGSVKRILAKGLDAQPYDETAPKKNARVTWASPPRFARDIASLITSPGGLS